MGFAEDIRKLATVCAGVGALGWIIQSNLDAARTALGSLDAEQLRDVSVAAAALSGMADEMLTAVPPEAPGADR